MGLSDVRRRVFTAAGSGAAIAAIFNTPLGGVFFAIELILLNDFSAPTLSAIILAAVSASTYRENYLVVSLSLYFLPLMQAAITIFICIWFSE